MNLVNLTPHSIVIISDGDTVTIPPSGIIARCVESTRQAGSINGIPLVRKDFGDVSGIPDQDPDTMYIVSALVRIAFPGRYDLVSPGDLVRDADGKPIGCRNLVMN